MRLSCPSCGAEYELPETLFLAGPRKVRCVKCRHSWLAHEQGGAAPPEAEASSPAPAAIDEAELPPRRPLPLRRRAPAMAGPPAPPTELAFDLEDPPASNRAVTVAWVASLLILAGACWVGWQYRADVVAAWPASARLYGALGDRPPS